MTGPTKLTRRLLATLAVLALACLSGFAQTASRVVGVPNPPNSAEQQQKSYVILISLDGFRYDYTKKYPAPHLVQMASVGASAPDGMIPAFPSSTFPNHLSIITGLYPEHHGIVANVFYDPARNETYSYGDHKVSWDGSWYSGVPLWSLAENNQMRAACFFWPASEAQVDPLHWNAGNRRPSYYVPFDPNVPDDERVEQVVAWLKLPPAERPHFITLYMEAVDSAGHQFGPDAPQTADAVKHVDEEIGKLETGIEATHLRVDLFVVADHGMQKTDPEWANLDQYADLQNFKTNGPLLYAATEAGAQKAYESLKNSSDKFKAYRRANVPAHLHYNENPRTGDPVVVATGPYYIRARRPKPGEKDNPPSVGTHGYDPQVLPTMKALFVAIGPDIRRGVTVPPFDNVDVYPTIAKILGLPVGKIDGDATALDGILKH